MALLQILPINNAMLYRTQADYANMGIVYPPDGIIEQPQGSPFADKSAGGATGTEITTWLVRFPVSLPVAARVVSAKLKNFNCGQEGYPFPRYFQGEYFPAFDGTFDVSNYTDEVGINAFMALMQNGLSEVSLANLINIPIGQQSYVAFRMGISGGNPYNGSFPALNYVTQLAPPLLELAYSTVQQPTLVNPDNNAIFRVTETIRLQWKHNDGNNVPQGRFKVEISTDAGANWTPIDQNSPNEYYDFLASNFGIPANTTVLWRVTTYSSDDTNVPSVVSLSRAFFLYPAPQTPTITAPIGEIATSRPIITGTSNDASRVSFRARVRVKNGAVVIGADSGEIIGTVLSWQIPVDLENLTNYTAELAIKTDIGVWSAFATADFNTVFMPPMTPTVALVPDDANGWITVAITNPVPDGNHDATVKNILQRFNPFKAKWEIIKGINNFIEPNGVYNDKSAVSGTNQYRVIALSGTGTPATSDSAEAVLHITSGFWIHDMVADDAPLHIPAWNGESEGNYFRPNAAIVYYEGREDGVLLSSQHRGKDFACTFVVPYNETLGKGVNLALLLKRLIQRDSIYCIRTFDGERYMGGCFAFPFRASNDFRFCYEVSLELKSSGSEQDYA